MDPPSSFSRYECVVHFPGGGVHSTSLLLAPQEGKFCAHLGANVHFTSKWMARGWREGGVRVAQGTLQPLRHCNTCNLPCTLSTADATERNRNSSEPAKSAVEIIGITENRTDEDPIYIAETEIACLDKLSLDGDLLEGVSDSE